MSLKLNPKEKLEELIGRLEIYEGAWAIRIKSGAQGTDELYVFPQETTRAKAEEILRRAYDLATGKDFN